MTQAYNLSQLANNLNSSGQLDATDGLVNAVPVANGGTGATTGSAARTNLGAAASGANTDITSLSAPALGAATATTQATNDNTTKVATTAFVAGQAGTATPLVDGTAAVGTSLLYARQDHVHPVAGIGYSQTWQDVLASRAASTDYTNSTGKPIQVNVWGISGGPADLVIGGVIACRSGINGSVPSVNLTGIVPPGTVYRVNNISTGAIVIWAELR